MSAPPHVVGSFAQRASPGHGPLGDARERVAAFTGMGADGKAASPTGLDTMPITLVEELAAPMYVAGLPCLVKVGDDNFAPRLSSKVSCRATPQS